MHLIKKTCYFRLIFILLIEKNKTIFQSFHNMAHVGHACVTPPTIVTFDCQSGDIGT